MHHSFSARLLDLFRRPSRLMDAVAEAPRWWQPGLLIFLAMIAVTWLTLPISGPEQLEQMRDSRIMQMMPEEAWQQQYDAAVSPTTSNLVRSSLGAAFTTWVLVLLFGFFLGFFARMSGGKGSFKQALGIVSWGAVLPFVVGSLVKLPLILATESVMSVSIGLAALARGAGPTSPLYMILATYGDFISWWGLAVLIIGFERVFAMSRTAAAVSVLLPWVIASAVPLGLSLFLM